MMSTSMFNSNNDSINPTIEIFVEDSYHPNTIMSNIYGNKLECPTFYGSEAIRGFIEISLNRSQSLNYNGIKLELIGMIDIHIKDDDNQSSENNNNQFNRFISLKNNISSQGTLNKEINKFNFEFKSIEKPYDSYRGKKFSIKYILLVTLNIGLNYITKEKEICIFNCDKNLKNIDSLFSNDPSNKVRVEIGVENLLHVCFELDRKNYHLKDAITGKVNFKKMNLELENMSLKIIKIESLFGKEGEIEPLGVFEIMDGSPSSTDDVIYFKMFLKGYNNLSQTIKNEMNDNVNVTYYISLEISDSENRNFFKKIEINLFRLPEEYYNKIRQNIIEGKNGVNRIFIKSENSVNKNSEANVNKNKIKNLFGNINNPLEPNLDDEKNEKNNNDDLKNKIIKEKNDINDINDIHVQNTKKISALFQSDF